MSLKTWIVKFKVIEALLYRSATKASLEGHYKKLHTIHHWTDCVSEDGWVFGIKRVWVTAMPDLVV